LNDNNDAAGWETMGKRDERTKFILSF